ncbi:hypothetical protein DFH06DRAFT_1137186 [Mycena polygramma]|nr:hypothetical protein DFH06DRAFT_1137186 [Mycena polygramma]
MVRNWHRIARVGQEKERMELDDYPLLRSTLKSVAHLNPHGTLRPRRVEYFPAMHSVTAPTTCSTPRTSLPTPLSRPSSFAPTQNFRGFSSSSVWRHPRRNALPSTPPNNVLQGAEHTGLTRGSRDTPSEEESQADRPGLSDVEGSERESDSDLNLGAEDESDLYPDSDSDFEYEFDWDSPSESDSETESDLDRDRRPRWGEALLGKVGRTYRPFE